MFNSGAIVDCGDTLCRWSQFNNCHPRETYAGHIYWRFTGNGRN